MKYAVFLQAGVKRRSLIVKQTALFAEIRRFAIDLKREVAFTRGFDLLSLLFIETFKAYD